MELGLNQGLYADVHFLLDDGSCPAHRPLLMARCDVMDAMFAGDFRESSAKVASPNSVFSPIQFAYCIRFIFSFFFSNLTIPFVRVGANAGRERDHFPSAVALHLHG